MFDVSWVRFPLSWLLGQGRKHFTIKVYRSRIKRIDQLTCANKALFLQHSFGASEIHREMKEALNVGDIKNAQEKKAELDHYIGSNFKSFFAVNAAAIIQHFEKSHRTSLMPPRVSIKIPFMGDECAMLRDLARYGSSYKTNDFPLENNLAISEVYSQNKPLCFNDIPSQIGCDYVNSRIDLRMANEYKTRNSVYKFFRNRKFLGLIDRRWIDCWKSDGMVLAKTKTPIGRTLHAEECYKSTFILPISLSADYFNGEFSTKIEMRARRVGINDADAENTENSMRFYGFLLVDHHWKNYFDEMDGEDISILEMIAAAFALYTFMQRQYTKYSKTYNSITTEQPT